MDLVKFVLNGAKLGSRNEVNKQELFNQLTNYRFLLMRRVIFRKSLNIYYKKKQIMNKNKRFCPKRTL